MELTLRNPVKVLGVCTEWQKTKYVYIEIKMKQDHKTHLQYSSLPATIIILEIKTNDVSDRWSLNTNCLYIIYLIYK